MKPDRIIIVLLLYCNTVSTPIKEECETGNLFIFIHRMKRMGDVQASDVQASDVQASDVQASDVQASDVQASDVQASDVQASKVKLPRNTITLLLSPSLPKKKSSEFY
jgi:hypothetical protein